MEEREIVPEGPREEDNIGFNDTGTVQDVISSANILSVNLKIII